MLKRFNELKLQTRLILILAPALLVGVVVSGNALRTLNRVDGLGYDVIIDSRDAAAALEAGNQVSRMKLAVVNYVVTGQPDYYEEEARHRAAVGEYMGLATTYDHWLLFDEVDLGMTAMLDAIKAALAEYDDHWAEVAAASDIESATPPGQAAIAAADEALAGLDDIYFLMLDYQDKSINKAENQVTLLAFSSLCGMGLFVGLIGLTMVLINRQVAAPLATLLAAADGLAGEEFDPAPVEKLAGRQDEVGYLARTLLRTVEEVRADEQRLQAEAADLREQLANLGGG